MNNAVRLRVCELHGFRCVYADELQHVLNGLLCRQTQGQTRIADSRLGILDAAGVVEVMELLRQCNGLLVETRRIAADSGLHDLLGQQSNLLDELTLICAG